MSKKILITQRIDKIEDINETRECIDLRLMYLCQELGFIPIQISSTIVEKYNINDYLNNFSFDGIILSGGNDINTCKIRDQLETKLLDYSKSNKIPLFGICRGLQMINKYQKGSLELLDQHCNTNHLIYGEGIFKNRIVNSYHNYGVTEKTLGIKLKPLAYAFDGSIEAIKHIEYPWMGIMWHPERDKKANKLDLELIKIHLNN